MARIGLKMDAPGLNAAAFWHRAKAFFADHGITIERVLTDNGSCYRSLLFWPDPERCLHRPQTHPPYRPQTNGKVERLNRTLLDEWAYVRPYSSNAERTEALADFLHTYNYHRCTSHSMVSHPSAA